MDRDGACKVVLNGLGVTFGVVGLAFLMAPDQVIALLNWTGRLLGSFAEVPASEQRLWVSLSFAYMSVVTALALLAASDPRRYLHLLPILALGKITSSLSGLGFYLVSRPAFAYLATFVVDGAIVLVVMGCYLHFRQEVTAVAG